MTIQLLNKHIKDLISDKYFVLISRNIFNSCNGCKEFNKIIRTSVKNRIGIYVWENNASKEIIYIGMAGKVKTNGEFVNHSVQKRLLASRGKDSSGKEIQTNQYVQSVLINDNIEEMNIHVFHLKENQIPGYIEAILINAYYQENKRLPKYNSSF